MRTSPIRRFLISASLALLVTAAAIAKTVQVGTCLPNVQTYPTISQAVTSVAPGSTIMVCPGKYPEQVAIMQPLTLKGVQSGNAANPTIIVPSGGLTKTVTTGTGNVYYQLLANDGTSGAVNISNISVDGNGNGLPNDAPLAGVFYSNTSGTVSLMAIFNQLGTGVGFGLIAENTGSSAVTVSVLHCSIHDFDQGGISIDGNLTATIQSSEIVTSSSFSGSSAPYGIVLYSGGTVANNRVITHPQPPGVSANIGVSIESDVVVADNTIENFTIGVWALGDSDTVTSNKVLLAGDGVVISGNNNDVEHNWLTNLPNGGAGISLNCTGTGNTVIHNVVNDAYWGILEPHGTNTIAANTFTNVANVISPPC